MPATFCGQCGTEIREGGAFCSECGWKVISTPPPQQTPYVPPQAAPPQSAPYAPLSSAAGPYAPPSREFNPMQQNAGAATTAFSKHNKSAGARLGIILFAAAAVIGILVLSVFLLSRFTDLDLLKSKPEVPLAADKDTDQSGNTTQPVGIQQNNDIQGEWTLSAKTLVVTVDGKTHADYAGMIGQSQSTKMFINAEEGMATLIDAYSGIEMSMPIELNKGSIRFGSDAEVNTVLYTGTLSTHGDTLQMVGEWENKTMIEDSEFIMKGTFTASKVVPLLSHDILSAAVDASSEELEGLYEGTLRYSKIINLDKMPQDEMPSEMIDLFLSLLNKDLPCRGEVSGNFLDIYFTIPEFGETDLESIRITEMIDGVYSEIDDSDEGTATIQVATLSENGTYRIVGAMEMKFNLPDGDQGIFGMEFEVSYVGPWQE